MRFDGVIRQATEADIPAISAMLTELAGAGMRTLRSDETFVRERYVRSPDRLTCALAVLDDEIMGLQILSVAREANHYGLPLGWGIIGTHVSPRAHRRGIGRALFEHTQLAGEKAGLAQIDASIGKTNEGALAYYESIGFRTYATSEGLVRKRYNYVVPGQDALLEPATSPSLAENPSGS